MEVYPATPIPSFSLITDHKFRTLVTDFESGIENRRSLWRFPKRIFSLKYNLLIMSAAERDTIYEFIQNRLGSYESFWFFDPKLRKWIDEYIGYGDGATATFDLPSKTTTDDATLKIYVAGVLKIDTVDYDFVSGGGAGGSDRITFIAGHIPAVGALITSDFNGYLRIKGRFQDDGFNEEYFTVNFVKTGVIINEVKN